MLLLDAYALNEYQQGNILSPVSSMLASKIWTCLKYLFIRLDLFLFPFLRFFDNLMIVLPTYYKNTENYSIFVLGFLNKSILILE